MAKGDVTIERASAPITRVLIECALTEGDELGVSLDDDYGNGVKELVFHAVSEPHEEVIVVVPATKWPIIREAIDRMLSNVA